jgi:hypothetical protein
MRDVYAALERVESRFAAQVGERRFATFKTVMAELAVQSDRAASVGNRTLPGVRS